MEDPVLEHCRRAIRDGSKSFYAAARIFDRSTRDSAFMLYAWCRFSDDQVDLQDLGRGGPREDPAESPARLARLEQMTRQALLGKSAGELTAEPAKEHPAFTGLRRVVTEHRIPLEEPFELLEGFRMDVEERRYGSLDELLLYCYRVAGVVGLMMARIMGVSDESTLDRATDLGLAFQMTNIARDVVDDWAAGRVYLPLAWLEEAGVSAADLGRPEMPAERFLVVERLLDEAERYYASSLVGISRLRFRHAWAIAAARLVYRDIGHRILKQGESAWERRAIVGVPRKVALLLGAAAQAAWAVTVRKRREPEARGDLWTRP